MISWNHIVDKMQVNIQGVEHDLRQIEKIDSRLYNNDDTQRLVQELGSKYTSSDIKKIHKDEAKIKPKRNIGDFFRGSVPKRPSQELQGRSSTEPKFGNCDEQSFVKSKPLKATPSKSQPLSGQLSKSKPETTLPIEENTERTTEKSSEKKRKSSKGTGKKYTLGLNTVFLMM